MVVVACVIPLVQLVAESVILNHYVPLPSLGVLSSCDLKILYVVSHMCCGWSSVIMDRTPVS